MMKADDVSSVTESHLLSHHDFSSSFSGEDDDGWLGEGVLTAAPLLGRDTERNEIQEAYQRVLQTQESQVVFVHGTSGQGKTTLIDTLREPVCESNGYFCSGKFFQDPGTQEPYSAITAAFSDLCDLVAQSPEFDEQSPEFDEQAQRRIQGFLALHGHLLSRSVNLSAFFSGDSMDLYSLCSSSAENASTFARFRAACKGFLLAMASKKHPVVLFIDDVQWMDTGSAKLLDFMKDDTIKNVMLVFSYRDEEAPAVEGLVQSYTGGQVTDIQLSNLDLSGVNQMLAYHLGSTSASNIDELGELTLQRTGGNPFFVCLFLETIGTDEFIVTHEDVPTFDVDAIRSSIMVAENIADFLSDKVSRLPSEVRDVLIAGSLIGYSFDVEMIIGVLPDILVKISTDKKKRKMIGKLLKVAVDEGFIERIKGGHQFSHDKVQRAFQDLADTDTKEYLHLLIGRMFLSHDKEGSIYNAAVHLNVSPGFLDTKEQWIRLARINFDASEVCRKSSAFDTAACLLRKGLELLDSIKMTWSHEALDLSFQLTESLARMSLLIGDFEACFEATREAIVHADKKERKVSLLLINVECRMATNDMEGSIKASIEALSELGVKFPTKLTLRHAMFKLIKLMFLMSKKTDEDMLSLPSIEDGSNTEVALRLLMHATFYATLINDEATAIYLNVIAVTLTIQHGLSTYTPPILSSFGVSVLQTGNVDRAYTWGKLAMALMEQNPSREADCATLGFAGPLLLHWKDPVCDLRDPLLTAATAGFDSGGDLVYSTYCTTTVNSMDLYDGVHLDVVETSLQSQYDRYHQLGQDELLCWLTPAMQFVANLRSSNTDWRQISLLAGEFMNSNKQANASGNQVLVAAGTTILKVRLANVFGFHGIARETFKDLGPLEHIFRSVFIWNQMCWEACVAYYEGFIAEGKRKFLRKARKYKKHLERNDALGPNATTFLKHLMFKESFLRRKRKPWTDLKSHKDETLCHLDRDLKEISLPGSFDKQPCYVIARAYADAGSIAEGMNCFGEARRYYERARDLYSDEWGAFAPASWIEEKCEFLPRDAMETDFDTQSKLLGDIVEFGCEEGLPI